MIVGLDALKDEAAGQVRAFAEAFNVPVITSYKAKGILPEDHPLSLGGAGLSPLADRTLVPFVQSSDLILCVGYDPIEMRPGWREIWDPSETRVIDIAAEPNRHYMHQASLSFLADCGAALDALGQGIPLRETWAGDEIATARDALRKAFPRDDAWGPAGVIAAARDALPPETIATVDAGAHRILLSQMWDCPAPRTLLQSTGLCTMGCAVPLAMGASLAAGDRPVVAFCGDGGMMMIAGELATAAELGLKTIFVVIDDSSLALIELKQRQRQLKNAGVDFGQHDFAAIGRAFGGQGHTVRSRDELSAALEQALAAETFSVIAAIVDRKSYDGRI